MAASDRVEQAITLILQAILDKDFEINAPLPPETQLASWLNVARPTMREAVRTLADRGVLKVTHGVGTFVVDPSKWTDLSMIIWWNAHTCSAQELGIYLVELRRMIEVGACGLAAERRNEDDLKALREALEDFDKAAEAGDMKAVATADLTFHHRIVRASKNPFLIAVMEPLEEALFTSREDTTRIEDVRTRARQHHWAIFECIKAGDSTAAKETMRSHMTQTRDDIMHHLNSD
ncbi:MAG: FadR/GntR family transcriptional regulator [Actinomycetaceae bacterium]|nr:FadR/GntR family transcriptional regulator [Actinomycetaceae bacterium]